MKNINSKKTKNKVWLENGIVNYVMSAGVDEEEAIILNKIGLDYINSGKATEVLIDLKQQSSKFSSSARKIWVKFLQNKKIKKAAMFGGNIIVRTLASFVIAASGTENIKFFDSKEKAVEWLEK